MGKKPFFLFTGLMVLGVILLQCTVDNSQFTGPVVDQDKYLIYKTFAPRSQQLLSDGDTTTIILELINASNQPVGNIGANFDARLGLITATDTTDTAHGRATALYTSQSAGIDRILVSTGSKEDSLFLLVVDRLTTVALSADTTELLADGESHVQIHGQVTDQTGSPQTDLTLYFQTTAGTISPTGTTDSDGQVTVTLTAPADSQDVTGVVRASLQPFAARTVHKKIPDRQTARSQRPGEEPSGGSHSSLARTTATTTDSLTILFRGISISLIPERTELLASGIDTTRILVALSEAGTHAPLAFHPFTASATRGIVSGDFVTDDNGQAEIILTSSTYPGISTVTVGVGNRVEASTNIEFISAVPTTLTLFSDATTILADGTSSSHLTATLLDTLGNPVVGKTLLFSASAGQLSRTTASTNSQGEATVTLTSQFSSTDLQAAVTVRVVGYNNLLDSTRVTFMGISMSLVTAASQLVADGTNSTTVSAVVFQTSTNGAVVNKEVEFSTSLGTITSPGITNSSGVAEATLTAGIFPGTATVIASFGGNLRDTTTVTFLNSGPHSIHLGASETNILADGLSQSTLTVTVLDTLDNPVEGALVAFAADQGNVSPASTTTDADGVASAVYTSFPSTGDTTAVVTATINAAQQLLSYRLVYQPRLPAGMRHREAPLPLRPESTPAVLADSLTIQLRGVTVTVSAAEPVLVANGVSTSDIVTRVLETTTNNPVADADINFSTTLGTITATAATSGSGEAVATLTSPYVPGTAQVVARYGPALTDTTTVEFLSGSPNRLSAGVETESLLADGVSSTTVYADVTDTLGNPLPNVLVQFSASAGTLSDALTATDDNGRAAVILTSEASTADLTSTVTCQVQGAGRLSRSRAVLQDSVLVQFRGITIGVSAGDTVLVANGSSTTTVQAALYETVTYTPLTNVEVIFSSDRGAITASAFTNTSGLASVTFTAGAVAGPATVVARTGATLSDTLTIHLLTGGPRHLVLTSDQSSILADGSSSLTLTASVTDTLDNPVAGRPVTFSASHGTLDPTEVTTDDQGIASVILTSNASRLDESVAVAARIPNQSSIADSLSLLFRGISIQVTAQDTILVADGSAATGLTALVTETEHNASVANAEVRFSTDLGLITGSATTDINGLATGTLTAGLFAGTAHVVAETGIGIRDTVRVHLVSHQPRSLILTADATSLLADGESQTTLTGQVVDSLNAPVAQQPVTLTTTKGTLSATDLSTDENGNFTVVLTSAVSTTDLQALVRAQVAGQPSLMDSVQVDFRGYHLNLSVDPAELSADGQSGATLFIEILETTSGNPVVNKAYSLSTNLGSIPAGGQTDINGEATAVLTSGTTPGTATIRVQAGVEDSISVTFFSTSPTTVTASAAPAVVLGDGETAAQVTVTVEDTLGNPVEGVEVVFPAVGTFSPATATTDAQGQVHSNWTLATTSDSTAQGVVTLSGYSATSDTMSVLFQGVDLLLEADPSAAYADGSSTIDVVLTARVKSTGNPIQAHTFSLATDLGQITPGGFTSSAGIGTGILSNPASDIGTATITATLGQLTTTTTASFTALIPDSIIVTSGETSLLADGITSTILTARVFNPAGIPTAGIEVSWSTDHGTLTPASSTSDSAGQVTATLVSEASSSDLMAVVQASSTLNTSIQDTIHLPFHGVQVQVSVDNHYLVADGISATSVTALVAETTTGNPVANGTVNWSTTLGIIPASSQTNALGRATTTLSTGTTAGTAVVTAEYGLTLSDTAHVYLAQQHDSTLVVSWYNPSGNPSNGTEQLTVTAIFADANAYPIDSVDVNFSLEPATMGVIQSPVMTNVNGLATTSLIYSIQYAGEIIRIWARSNGISGYVDVTLPEAN